MFESITKNSNKESKSILVYIVFGAIALVFIFFNYYSGSTAMGGYAARVNNRTISLSEYKQAVDQTNQYYSKLFGGAFNSNPQQSKYIEQASLDRLVSGIVITDGAQDAGLQIPDGEIKDVIVTIPAFEKDGRFQKDNYLAYLRNMGMSPAQFEDQLRRDLASQKVQRFFGQTLVPSDAEVRRSYLARESKMNLSFATLDTTSAGTVSDKEAFAFAQDATHSKELEDFFKANTAKYAQAEEVHARHILIGFKSGDKASEDVAKNRIDAIAERVKKEDFGKVAAEVSEDPGSKAKSGDLGYFAHGRMVPEFDKAAFGLAVGKVSDPVKSPFGYHLIKVEDHKQAGNPTLADVKTKVAHDSLSEQREKSKRAELEKAAASGDVAAVDKAVKELGLKWEDTGMFGRFDDTIPKIQASEAMADQIAGLDEKSPVLKQLVSSGSKYTVVKLKELKTAGDPKETDLKTVRDEISKSQSMGLLQAWVEKLKTKAVIVKNTRMLGNGSEAQN